MSRPGRVPRGRALAGRWWVRAGIARPGRVPRGEDPGSTEARGTHGTCGIGVESPGGAGAGAAGAGCAERGLVEAELHIRPGPVIGGSAESCGNAPAFNAGEILPCAERIPLHMGARPLKTGILVITLESCGKPGIGPRGRRSPMCNTPRSCGAPRRVRVPGAAGTGGRGPRPGRRARAGGRDGERGPVNREEWRSGRIVPPRTRRPPRRSRGIMRMPPGASGARRRTILPERQNRGRGRGRTDGD